GGAANDVFGGGVGHAARLPSFRGARKSERTRNPEMVSSRFSDVQLHIGVRAGARPGMTPSSLLRRIQRVVERRVVRIALGAAAVEGGLVGCIERRALFQPLDQIGIGDE